MPVIGIGTGIVFNKIPPDPGVAFDMLENGLDFITEAVEAINSSSNHKKLKYAVIHLSSGVELIFKEVLRAADWRLIFQEIKEATPELLQSGDFKSITFKIAIQRLESNCKVNFCEENKRILEELRIKRNKIEHFKFNEKVKVLRILSAKVLSFLIQFIESHIDIDSVSTLSKNYIKKLPAELAKFSTYNSVHNRKGLAKKLWT